jgi:hypothetical protein
MKRQYEIFYRGLAVAVVLAAVSAWGGERGWGVEDPYGKLYKNSERDRVKGVVQGFKEIVPMDGMDPGLALIVKDSYGDDVEVHLGPKPFVSEAESGLRVGDEVKVKGVWAELKGRDIFMAAKVKRGEYSEYKVRRTRDGMPFWALSPEELEKERRSD